MPRSRRSSRDGLFWRQCNVRGLKLDNAAEFLDCDHLGDVRHDDRPRTLADHCRFDRRRGRGCAVCGLRDPEIAGPGPDGPGGSRDHPPQHAGDASPVSSRVAHLMRFGFPVRTHVIRALPLENWEGTPFEALLRAGGIILGTPAVIGLALVTWTRRKKRLA